jgi:uncharacterized sulfatase
MGSQTKNQFIFIITDTPRKDMVGYYGNPNLLTPNQLDYNTGLRMENATRKK